MLRMLGGLLLLAIVAAAVVVVVFRVEMARQDADEDREWHDETAAWWLSMRGYDARPMWQRVPAAGRPRGGSVPYVGHHRQA